jgi:hypothetical protein
VDAGCRSARSSAAAVVPATRRPRLGEVLMGHVACRGHGTVHTLRHCMACRQEEPPTDWGTAGQTLHGARRTGLDPDQLPVMGSSSSAV